MRRGARKERVHVPVTDDPQDLVPPDIFASIKTIFIDCLRDRYLEGRGPADSSTMHTHLGVQELS